MVRRNFVRGVVRLRERKRREELRGGGPCGSAARAPLSAAALAGMARLRAVFVEATVDEVHGAVLSSGEHLGRSADPF